MDYRQGDQVLVTRNDHERGLLNGTAGTVTSLDQTGLTLALPDSRLIHLDRPWLERGELTHAYALTLHKAQGRTVHTALLLATHGTSAEAGYVGLSRGTDANHLYLDDAGRRDSGVCASAATRQGRDMLGADRSRSGLSRLTSQHLAHEQLPSRALGRGR